MENLSVSRGCTAKMGQIFFALESYENWGSYQDSIHKESSKISGKKIDHKVTVWQENGRKSRFTSEMLPSP